MKHVLIAKLTSLGDIVHTFPALVDAAAARSDIEFDWLVDAAFADVVRRHPAVRRVVSIALRELRDGLPGSLLSAAPWRLRRELRGARYDLVIDAQGLLKSMLLARLAGAPVAGFDRASAREPLAALGYARRHHVARNMHAIARTRALFAAALGYPVPVRAPCFGVPRGEPGDAVLLLHGSSWPSKAWPVSFWHDLAERLVARGSEVWLPHGNERERARAREIAAGTSAEVMPQMSLAEMLNLVATSRAVIGVDSGLMHFAAAMGVPAIGLYGATDPDATGACGPRARSLTAAASLPCRPCVARRCQLGETVEGAPPCMAAISVEEVCRQLEAQLA